MKNDEGRMKKEELGIRDVENFAVFLSIDLKCMYESEDKCNY